MARDGLIVFILVSTIFATGVSTLTDSCAAPSSDEHTHCDAAVYSTYDHLSVIDLTTQSSFSITCRAHHVCHHHMVHVVWFVNIKNTQATPTRYSVENSEQLHGVSGISITTTCPGLECSSTLTAPGSEELNNTVVQCATFTEVCPGNLNQSNTSTLVTKREDTQAVPTPPTPDPSTHHPPSHNKENLVMSWSTVFHNQVTMRSTYTWELLSSLCFGTWDWLSCSLGHAGEWLVFSLNKARHWTVSSTNAITSWFGDACAKIIDSLRFCSYYVARWLATTYTRLTDGAKYFFNFVSNLIQATQSWWWYGLVFFLLFMILLWLYMRRNTLKAMLLSCYSCVKAMLLSCYSCVVASFMFSWNILKKKTKFCKCMVCEVWLKFRGMIETCLAHIWRRKITQDTPEPAKDTLTSTPMSTWVRPNIYQKSMMKSINSPRPRRV